ncbi:MAG: ABC transporter substrate-binding protein [Mariprofundaceae bacterium]|nr:ABC transporter substrate-binding protein [Mariprofundaceae bacterium]
MRVVFPVKALIVAVLTVLAVSNAWAKHANDPKSVIEGTVNEIIQILEAREDKTKLTEEDRENIRKVVAGHFDYREMSKRSLGKAWKSTSESERKNFTELFRKLLERSYGNRLASFREQRVEFDDAQFKKDKARVKTRVVDVNKEIPVEYRLHQTSTGWQVYDIRIEGVSLVSNFRKDFQEGIRKNKGFEGLVQALEKKVKKLEEKDNA